MASWRDFGTLADIKPGSADREFGRRLAEAIAILGPVQAEMEEKRAIGLAPTAHFHQLAGKPPLKISHPEDPPCGSSFMFQRRALVAG